MRADSVIQNVKYTLEKNKVDQQISAKKQEHSMPVDVENEVEPKSVKTKNTVQQKPAVAQHKSKPNPFKVEIPAESN